MTGESINAESAFGTTALSFTEWRTCPLSLRVQYSFRSFAYGIGHQHCLRYHTLSLTLQTRLHAGLNKFSSRITQPKYQGASQAMLFATGLREEDMIKPQVRTAAQQRASSSARTRAPKAGTHLLHHVSAPALRRCTPYHQRTVAPHLPPCLSHGLFISPIACCSLLQVGISSVWYEGNPCNMHLMDLAAEVKKGVEAMGMVGFRFNTIGVSDGISMGTDGMSFSLQVGEQE